MTITGAEAFLAIVSTKSISKAAELLFLSQSTVSFQLKTLEKELGVMLVERQQGHRQVELTKNGIDFVNIAERFVQLWKEAHALKLNNDAVLSISSVDSINIYTFSSFFKQIVRGEPSIRLKIFTHQTPEIFEQVENRAVDIGFVLSQRRYRNIIMKPLFHEKLFYVKKCDCQNPDSNETGIHPSNLCFEKEILFNWGPEYLQWHDAWCNPNTQTFLQVDTITMLMIFLDNEYWTILPASLVKVLQTKYPLTVRQIEDGPPDRVCYKLTHRYPRPAQIPAMVILETKLDEFLIKNSYQWHLNLHKE